MKTRKMPKNRREKIQVPLSHPLGRAFLFALVCHPGSGHVAQLCAPGRSEAGGQGMTETPDSPMSQHQPWTLVPRGINVKEGLETNRWHLPSPAGSFRHGEDQVPTDTLSRSSHAHLSTPQPIPGATVWRCPLLQGAASALSQLVAVTSVQNAYIGSISGSVWLEA